MSPNTPIHAITDKPSNSKAQHTTPNIEWLRKTTQCLHHSKISYTNRTTITARVVINLIYNKYLEHHRHMLVEGPADVTTMLWNY